MKQKYKIIFLEINNKEVEDDGKNVTNRLFGTRVPEMGSDDVIMICKLVQFYAHFI